MCEFVLFPLLLRDRQRCTEPHRCLTFFAMSIGLEVLLPRSLMAQVANLGVRDSCGRVALARQLCAAGTPFVTTNPSTIFQVDGIFRVSPPR